MGGGSLELLGLNLRLPAAKFADIIVFLRTDTCMYVCVYTYMCVCMYTYCDIPQHGIANCTI